MRHPKFNWRAIIIGGWLAALGVSMLVNFWPASFWFEPKTVWIFDTEAGHSPHMAIDREIHRPFRADWTVEVERMEPRGFSLFCSSQSRSLYQVDAVLPPDLDLTWWMNRPCALTPGFYRVETSWVIHASGFPDKEVSVVSNTFEVRDAAGN